jgi:hypothetical protein
MSRVVPLPVGLEMWSVPPSGKPKGSQEAMSWLTRRRCRCMSVTPSGHARGAGRWQGHPGRVMPPHGPGRSLLLDGEKSLPGAIMTSTAASRHGSGASRAHEGAARGS